MLRSIVLVILVINSAIADVKVKSVDTATAAETTRGGGPYSQQYHYSSYGGSGGGHDAHHGGGHDHGLTFDVSTGVYLALAAILLLLAFLLYPLFNKHGGGGGWDSGWRRLGKSYDFAATTNKVLSAVENMYDKYQKAR